MFSHLRQVQISISVSCRSFASDIILDDNPLYEGLRSIGANRQLKAWQAVGPHPEMYFLDHKRSSKLVLDTRPCTNRGASSRRSLQLRSRCG